MNEKRRLFLKRSAGLGAGVILAPWMLTACNGSSAGSEESGDMQEGHSAAEMFFSISLAEWSLHKTLFKKEMTNLDFPQVAKEKLGIDAIEFVNQFFKDKAQDMAYLKDLKQRCDDQDVKSLIIMCDGEGNLGDADEAARTKAVENHYKWVEAAKFLGCHSIRVNAAGQGTAEEVHAAAVDGLGRLSEFAQTHGLNVIVENHGGYSSSGEWLAGVMAAVGMDNCGTLPDFGNFCIEREMKEVDGKRTWNCVNEYDRYQGVHELMPYAKSVSAKSHQFNEAGDEINTDYLRMMQIVKDAGYTGYVGIEYEGSELSEMEGIRKTHELLKRVGQALG